MTTSRRTVTTSIAWGVPAVIAAGAAPAFAASPVPTTPPQCVPSDAVTGSRILNLRSTATSNNAYTLSFADWNTGNTNGPAQDDRGLITLGNGNGIATVTFQLPTEFDRYSDVRLTMDYVGVNDAQSDDEIWYWVNAIPTRSPNYYTYSPNARVFAGMVTNDATTVQVGAVLNASGLRPGANTITFGMPRRDAAPFLYMTAISQLNLTWTELPAVVCP